MLYSNLAADLTLALDRAEFMRSLGYEPDAWQAEFLRDNAKRILLNCSRQSGKSTVASILALHEAVYKPKSLILLLSASLRQSLELYGKVIDAYLRCGLELSTDRAKAKTTELLLSNGSRIVSLPSTEKTIRGFSGVDLLICDEAARIDDDLYYAVEPMLAVSGGRLIMLSTPYGERGIYHELWVSSDWKRYRITADDCPRISPDFLENARKVMPNRIFRQEFYCEFLQTENAVFSYDDIMGLTSTEITPLFGGNYGS